MLYALQDNNDKEAMYETNPENTTCAMHTIQIFTQKATVTYLKVEWKYTNTNNEP